MLKRHKFLLKKNEVMKKLLLRKEYNELLVIRYFILNVTVPLQLVPVVNAV
jgi:hypothetical protein